MVPIVRLFRNLPALFALVCATTGQGADPIYRKVGDSVVLNPGQPFNAISSATWKHNTDLASEWFGTGNVDCYRDFKGRCSLNKKDGSFTISNLKVEDSGSYTPEINDKVLNQLELQVIEPVPKPTVSVKCNYEKTLCNLTCEANINPDVGTVKYEWRTGEVVLSNNKELIITENKESSFICMLKNRVSSSSSDGVDNPLSRGNPGAAAGLAAAIVILIVAPALAVIGRFGWYRFKNRKFPTWKEFWCCGKKKAKGGDSESAEVEKKLLPVNKKSDLEVKTSNNHEPNGRWPPETLQTVNENETNISESSEEREPYQLASETLTSDPTGSGEEDKPFYQASDNLTSGPTDQKKDPAKDSSSENQGEQHLDSNPKQTQQPNDGTASEKPKDPDCDPSIVSAEVSAEPETNISGSSEEHEQNHLASDTVTRDPTEGEALTSDDEEKDENEAPSSDEEIDGLGQKLPTISANENQGEQHQVFSPEGETRKQSENNQDVEDKQGNQPGFTSETAKAGSEPKTNNHETNGGRSTTTEQNTSKDEGEASPREEDDQHQKPAEKSPSENHRDSSTVEQNSKESETCNLKSAKAANQNVPSVNPVTSGPTDVKAPSSDEEKDDQGKESAEKSSGVKLGEQHLNSNPNRIQQPNDGTENTSETPSGPETSDRGSVV